MRKNKKNEKVIRLLEETYSSDPSAQILENSAENSGDYSVSASDYYCEVIQTDNTVLYVTSYIDYKEDAKKIINDLGY